MTGFYVQVNGSGKKGIALYTSVGSVARKIEKGYLGVNGVAQPLYYAQAKTLLAGKKVIILGEHELGVDAPGLAACVAGTGCEVVYQVTEDMLNNILGYLPDETQSAVLSLSQQYPREKLLVLLGQRIADVAEMYAQTVTTGDPSWMGVLAGVELHLDVWHIFEPEIKELIPAQAYQTYVAQVEADADVQRVISKVKEARMTNP